MMPPHGCCHSLYASNIAHHQGQGVIVNPASILGLVGFQMAAAYVASKHGVVG
jgi:NAD(P)-dependent dehydrogenase (short-subunit alcohol dehydrogenase family)